MKKKPKNKKTATGQNAVRTRRLHLFTCQGCGRPRRQSFRKRKADRGLCRNCRRGAVHEDQQSLFPLPADFDEVRRVPGNPALSGEAAAAFVNASKRKADRLIAKSLTFPVGTSYTDVHGNVIDAGTEPIGIDARMAAAKPIIVKPGYLKKAKYTTKIKVTRKPKET